MIKYKCISPAIHRPNVNAWSHFFVIFQSIPYWLNCLRFIYQICWILKKKSNSNYRTQNLRKYRKIWVFSSWGSDSKANIARQVCICISLNQGETFQLSVTPLTSLYLHFKVDLHQQTLLYDCKLRFKLYFD